MDGIRSRRVVRVFGLGRCHQHGSGAILAHQHAPCNAGIGSHIEAVGAQQFQRLIEMGWGLG